MVKPSSVPPPREGVESRRGQQHPIIAAILEPEAEGQVVGVVAGDYCIDITSEADDRLPISHDTHNLPTLHSESARHGTNTSKGRVEPRRIVIIVMVVRRCLIKIRGIDGGVCGRTNDARKVCHRPVRELHRRSRELSRLPCILSVKTMACVPSSEISYPSMKSGTPSILVAVFGMATTSGSRVAATAAVLNARRAVVTGAD